MARNFNGGTDMLTYDMVSGGPYASGALSAWLRTSSAVKAVPTSCWQGGSSLSGIGLIISNTANKITGYIPSGATLTSTTSVNDGNWHHIAFNYINSSGSCSLYVDGVSEATASGGFATIIGGTFCMGDNVDTFWNTYVGDLAEVAYWLGATLTADEITALSKGISPLRIGKKGAGRLFYAPLVRETHDIAGIAPTVSGGSVIDHPRVVGGVV